MTKLLAESGAELSHEELLDALWLTSRLPLSAAPLARAMEQRGAPGPDAAPAQQPGKQDAAETGSSPVESRRRPRSPYPLLASAEGRRAAGDGAAAAVPAHPVGIPDHHSLGPRRLRLEKSLRPLRQRFPSRLRHALDIPRTVAAMAETRVPDIITRPLRTRWLTLALVVDDGISMVLWQRLASDIRALMERAGSFRDVRVYGLDTRGGAPTLRSSPYGYRTRSESPKALCDPTGNTLTLVISDGVGEAWRNGGMRQVMEWWTRSGPTAIVHALPARLWASTGIAARPWQVATPCRGGPTQAWHVTDRDLPPELVRFDSVPVPVLEPTSASVGTWARLVAAPGGTAFLPLWDGERVSVGSTDSGRSRSDRPDSGVPGAGVGAVLRFKEAASTEAYRLAAHVAAVAPVTPPVMRLVQAALGPPTDPGHLTEVFLGGLMHEVDADGPERLPHQRRFDFDAEARQALLSAVPPHELLHTAEAVTLRIESSLGRASGFPAWVGHPDGTAVVEDTGRSFGWIRAQLLTRLGIPLPADRRGAPEDDSKRLEPNATQVGGTGAGAENRERQEREIHPAEPSTPAVHHPDVSGAQGLDPQPADTPVVSGERSEQTDEALAPAEQALAESERVLGPDHPDTLTARADLALSYGELGRHDEATLLQERVVADYERILGPDHPDTLTARAYLAFSYGELGRHDEATLLQERVVVDSERILGPDHPDTLTARTDLAYSYEEAGRMNEAIALEESVLADSERVLGPDHPDTLTARTDLAFSYEEAGRIDEAIALQEHVLADRERVLGPDHPDTLTARANLAYSYRQAEQVELAITLQEHVLADRERVLGPDHPMTLTARTHLATTYYQAGRTEEAITLEESVLADREHALGPDHPDTLTARANLALSYRQAERVDEAVLMQEHVLADYERAQGPDHPDTLTARTHLALSYRQAERFDEAITQQEHVLADYERVLGPDHPNTLTARTHLATTYYQAGRTEEAITLEEHVLAVSERVLGPDHPDTLTARANLALSYRQAEQLDEAITLQEHVLAVSERVLGPDHPDTLTARTHLATTYHQAGRTEEATTLQERVRADRERVVGPRDQ
ncbi:tetratricopeptide repeat protein [Streptomyces sp. NPDC059446]|uniref:tetratricopeptide repeat protein n=2 Tax=unclassified Streptomyces TaxID=2593676 RepID=UPI0036AEC224